MPLELVNNTTKEGLFNRLLGLYTLVEDAYNDASDTNTGYDARVPFVYNRFKARPEPNEGTSVDLLNSYNTRYANTVSIARDRGTKTLLRMVGDEYKIVDNDIAKSIAFLVIDMQQQNQTIGRATTQIAVSANAANVGKADILVTDIIPLPAMKGLADESGVQKQADKSSYVYNETIAVAATSSETISEPPEFNFEGDESRNYLNDYNWAAGGSGLKDFSLRGTLIDMSENKIANASFEVILDNAVIDRWTKHNNNTNVGYDTTTSTHGNNSLVFFNGNTNHDSNLIYQGGITLEPYKVYFVAFNARASVAPSANAVLRVRFVTDENQPVAATFYNASKTYAFGSGSGQIPVGSNFGLVYHPIITDNTVTTDKNYRIQLSVAVGAGESWASTAKVFVDRLFLVEAKQLYDMGPYVAILCSIKGSPTKLGDNYIITISNNQMEYWNWVFAQLFDIRTLNAQLPVSDTPTITKTNVQ